MKKEDTSKILELMDKAILALDNGKIIADQFGVSIGDRYQINSMNTSIQGELTLTISCKNSDTIHLMSYDYPDLKPKMIELQDSIKASRMDHLTNSVIIPMITEIDKKL